MDAMDNTDGWLLRPALVAEMLGVSRSWLYEAANQGRIPCVRLGGIDGPVRFRRGELDAWIAQSHPGRDRARDASAAVAALPAPARRNRRAPADGGQLHLIPPVDR
jgi:excisionase family DNA binding protein